MVAESKSSLIPSQPDFDRGVIEITVSNIQTVINSFTNKQQWLIEVAECPYSQYPQKIYSNKISDDEPVPLLINPGIPEKVRVVIERKNLANDKNGNPKDPSKTYNYRMDIIEWGTALPLSPSDGQNYMADVLLRNSQLVSPPNNQVVASAPKQDIDEKRWLNGEDVFADDILNSDPSLDIVEPDNIVFSTLPDLNKLEQLFNSDSNKMMTSSTAFKGAIEIVGKHLDLYPINRPEGMNDKDYQETVKRFVNYLVSQYTDSFRNILYGIEESK